MPCFQKCKSLISLLYIFLLSFLSSIKYLQPTRCGDMRWWFIQFRVKKHIMLSADPYVSEPVWIGLFGCLSAAMQHWQAPLKPCFCCNRNSRFFIAGHRKGFRVQPIKRQAEKGNGSTVAWSAKTTVNALMKYHMFL